MRASSGLGRRVDEQDRPSGRPGRRRGDLVVVATYGRKTRSPEPSTAGLMAARCSAGAPIGRDRQELERPGDRVVEGGEVVERRLALGLGHQLEVEWGELEPAAQLTPDPEGVLLDGSRRPGRQAERPRWATWPRTIAEGRSHGAATGLRAR